MVRIGMIDVIRFLLIEPVPSWVVALLVIALGVLFWRLSAVERKLRRHARSIANMDAWADVTDERLERVDWIKMRQKPANDARRKIRMTG